MPSKPQRRARKPVVKRSGGDGQLEKRSLYEMDFVKKYAQEEPTYSNFSGVKVKLRRHAICVGGTASGKTSTTLRMLLRDMGCFERIYLLAKDLDEPLYASLIAEPDSWCDGLEVVASEDIGAWPKLWAELNAELKEDPSLRFTRPTCLVVDDMLGEKPSKAILDTWNRGRKLGLSCIYITSSASDIDKRIRNNAEYKLCFHQNSAADAKRFFQLLGIDQARGMRVYQKAMNRSQGGAGFVMIDQSQEAHGTPLELRNGYEPCSSGVAPDSDDDDYDSPDDSDDDEKARQPPRPRQGAKGRASTVTRFR